MFTANSTTGIRCPPTTSSAGSHYGTRRSTRCIGDLSPNTRRFRPPGSRSQCTVGCEALTRLSWTPWSWPESSPTSAPRVRPDKFVFVRDVPTAVDDVGPEQIADRRAERVHQTGEWPQREQRESNYHVDLE